jgi:hypothetical protein
MQNSDHFASWGGCGASGGSSFGAGKSQLGQGENRRVACAVSGRGPAARAYHARHQRRTPPPPRPPAVAASAAIKTRMNPVWDEKAAAGGGLLLSPRQKDRGPGDKKNAAKGEKAAARAAALEPRSCLAGVHLNGGPPCIRIRVPRLPLSSARNMLAGARPHSPSISYAVGDGL